MNHLWSTRIQRTSTLYESRSLRFHDLFREQYINAFAIPDGASVLEIGCGPGALAEALARWYPRAAVTGVDRDSNFISFAASHAPHIRYLEGDATALPFPDSSFDVTISNTVQEHIPPDGFYGEQRRILKPDGVCLVLSARRGYHIPAPCVAEETPLEREVYEAVAPYGAEDLKAYNVGAYATDERGIPAAMEQYGFREVSTAFLTVNLTPDNPIFDRTTAHAIINANRRTSLDYIDCIPVIAPGVIPAATLDELRAMIHAKYDERIRLYDRGVKQWDCNVSVTMVTRGIK